MCLCTTCKAGSQEQRRALDPLEVKSQMTVSPHVAYIRVHMGLLKNSLLLTTETSLEQSRFVVVLAFQTGSNVTQVGLQQVANLGLGLSILLHLLRLLAG